MTTTTMMMMDCASYICTQPVPSALPRRIYRHTHQLLSSATSYMLRENSTFEESPPSPPKVTEISTDVPMSPCQFINSVNRRHLHRPHPLLQQLQVPMHLLWGMVPAVALVSRRVVHRARSVPSMRSRVSLLRVLWRPWEVVRMPKLMMHVLVILRAAKSKHRSIDISTNAPGTCIYLTTVSGSRIVVHLSCIRHLDNLTSPFSSCARISFVSLAHVVEFTS